MQLNTIILNKCVWQSYFYVRDVGGCLELPYGVGIVGKVGNELGRTQWNPTPSLLDKLDVKLI